MSFDGQAYSVPYRYVGHEVRIRATSRVIEVFHRQDRFPIATHLRLPTASRVTTNPEHQPDSHRAYAQDQGAELIAWAQRSGESISAFMRLHSDNDPALADAILDRLVHSSAKIVLRGDSMRKLKAGVA